MDGPRSVDSIMSMITSIAGMPSGESGQRSAQQNELLGKIRDALMRAFSKNSSGGTPNLQEFISLASKLLTGTGNSESSNKIPDFGQLSSLLESLGGGNLGGGNLGGGNLGGGNLGGGNGQVPDFSQLSSMMNALGGSNGKLPDFGALLSSLAGSQKPPEEKDPSLNKLSSVLSDLKEDD